MTVTAKQRKVTREVERKPVRHHHEEPLVEPPVLEKPEEDEKEKNKKKAKERLWYWEGLFDDTLEY